MVQHRGVTDSTLDLYDYVIADLLETVGGDPSRFDARGLRTFVLDRVECHAKSSAKNVTSAMRMFLRYLIAEGKCQAGLDSAIPSVAHWRLSALPRYLSASDVERLVAACDVSTRVGCRDRAIILLLARLGLRGGDIVRLQLTDIDWQEASLRVLGKGRREVRLPLTQEVGDAILAYLEQGRQPVSTEHLFIRSRAPSRPLSASHSVSNIVARALHRAGVVSPFRGAHVLRHSAATEMLRQGVSLQGIGAVLRHRSIETTAHYAKVDVALLRLVAQPWPEVTSC
jgi:site-specific recombinase XerD